MAKTKEEVIVGLMRGRNEIPVSDYIFDELEDVMDFRAIQKHINSFLEEKVGVSACYGECINQWDYTDVLHLVGEQKLVVYMTEFSSVTASLVACCARKGIHLTLMHFNAQTREFVPQYIF